MKEIVQAGRFYNELDEPRKNDLCEAIAEDIFFLDENLKEKIMGLFRKVSNDMEQRIRKINTFT